MAHDDLELQKLTAMLQQCLGRIDEEAFRLQDADTAGFDFGEAERIDDATCELQGLVESLLVVDADNGPADVNEIVARVARDCLHRLDVPIVQRLQLCRGATRVDAAGSLVSVAVQRAVELATASLGPGGELDLSTRLEQGAVLVEIESRGSDDIGNVAERSATLQAFVEDFGGGCTARAEKRDLFLVLELPQVMATDPGDRA